MYRKVKSHFHAPAVIIGLHKNLMSMHEHLRTNPCHKAPNRKEKKRVSRKQKPETGIEKTWRLKLLLRMVVV